MYAKYTLGLEESMMAINAMIEEHKKNPSNSPVGMAVVDEGGLLIAYARTDGARPIISKNAIKKAYTAALTGSNSEDYETMLNGRGWRVGDMGAPMLMSVPGGITVRNPEDGSILGGIGVAGLPAGPGDDDLALVGLRALNL